MMTKMEMQYMDAVIQINRRQRNNEVDWEQRRYELAKAALFVAPALYSGTIAMPLSVLPTIVWYRDVEHPE